MAKHLGHETRFPSLVLNTNSQTSPSYTENGSMIPAENSAMKLFTRLFVNDTPAEQERQAELIRSGRSVMDVVGAEAKSLQRELGSGDRDKLDAWFTSVRELEQRLAANESWTHKPKPKVSLAPPRQIPRDNEVAVERFLAGALRFDSSLEFKAALPAPKLPALAAAKPTGLQGLLASIDGKKKLSTMEKSRHDWGQAKEKLDVHTRDEMERFAKDGKSPRPDLLISGMNAGANCGINTIYSGTVAAALEGAFLGVPAIAVSLHIGQGKTRFDVAAARARRVIEIILAGGLPEKHSCLSINIPITESGGPMPEIKVCPMNTHGLIDQYERRVSPGGDVYYWSAGHGLEFHGTDSDTDVDHLMKRCITVTPLQYDLTRHAQLDHWRTRLESPR
jgi:hypothetical protein